MVFFFDRLGVSQSKACRMQAANPQRLGVPSLILTYPWGPPIKKEILLEAHHFLGRLLLVSGGVILSLDLF